MLSKFLVFGLVALFHVALDRLFACAIALDRRRHRVSFAYRGQLFRGYVCRQFYQDPDLDWQMTLPRTPVDGYPIHASNEGITWVRGWPSAEKKSIQALIARSTLLEDER